MASPAVYWNMKANPKKSLSGIYASFGIVDLVAGPLCGEKIQWPEGAAETVQPYQFGHATYRLEEGGQTALYVEG